MPRNGSGSYAAPSNSVNPAVTTTTISPTDFNAMLADLEAALTASIANDGQTTASAAIPFASGITADTIVENSGNTGVTVEGSLLKDNNVTVGTSGSIITDTIAEKTGAAGVTIDGLLIKDGALGADTVATATIQDDAVTTAKILNDNVTTAKILNANVTTAKLADNAVTLAKLEDGTQGDILYYGASGAPTRLSAGTDGQLLQTQGAGANPVWATAGGQFGTLISSATASASASLDFTTDIDATYEVYALVFSRLVPTTGDQEMWLRISDDGGSTFESSNYNRSASGVRNTAANAAYATGQAQVELTGAPGANNAVGNAAAGTGISGVVFVYGPASTGRNHLVGFQTQWWDQLGQVSHMVGNGTFSGNTSAVDGLRLLFQSGTIASGEAYLYGVVAA